MCLGGAATFAPLKSNAVSDWDIAAAPVPRVNQELKLCRFCWERETTSSPGAESELHDFVVVFLNEVRGWSRYAGTLCGLALCGCVCIAGERLLSGPVLN